MGEVPGLGWNTTSISEVICTQASVVSGKTDFKTVLVLNIVIWGHEEYLTYFNYYI